VKRFLLTVAALMAASAFYAGVASAYCGPGFSNKAQAVSFYESAAGQKYVHALKAALVRDGLMHADQDFLAFIQSDKVVNAVTPIGYKLDYNSSCKADGSFQNYDGLYVHSGKNVLAVVVGKKVKKINGGKPKVIKTSTKVVKNVQTKVKQPDGSVKVFETTTFKETITLSKGTTVCELMKPFEKGYCRNYVRGHAFEKCRSTNMTYTQSKTYTKKILLKTIPAPTAPGTTPTGNCNNVTIIIYGSGNNVNVCSVQITIVCSGVQLVVSGPNSEVVNKAITEYQNTHDCNTVVTPTPTPTPSPGHGFLAKTATKDGVNVTLAGGEFTFSVSINGAASTTITNAASGANRDLGSINAGSTVLVCETNTGDYTPDTPCISHTFAAAENFTFSFINRKTTPAPTSCVTITSVIDLNDVPAGLPSGRLPFSVNSCGAGSVTVDPGNGGISTCDSSTKQLTPLVLSLSQGDNSLCVIYYAPSDSAATSGSITYTAIQGPAKDVKVDTFAITHPVRNDTMHHDSWGADAAGFAAQNL
jgi:hypothetical protein